MDILILCNADDSIAPAVYQQLVSRGNDVKLVTAEQLIFAPSWKHQLDENGNSSTEIKLRDGSIISSEKIKAVWNRIRYFPPSYFLNEVNRQYAQTEIYCLYYSFLKSIDPLLLDPVQTYDFAMEGDTLPLLREHAAKAGLPILDFQFTTAPKWQSSKELVPVTDQRTLPVAVEKQPSYLIWLNQPTVLMENAEGVEKVWIVGEQIFAEKQIAPKTALKKMARNCKKRFMEIHFAKAQETYKYHLAITFPTTAPDQIIEALSELLEQKKNKTL